MGVPLQGTTIEEEEVRAHLSYCEWRIRNLSAAQHLTGLKMMACRTNAYNGAYSTGPARQRLLLYTDLEDDTSSLTWTAGGGGSPTWRRVSWALGIALSLVCTITKSLTTLYATARVYPNTLPMGPYTKAAIGHAGVTWLSGCLLLLGRGSARIHSSRHFFLIVGALTFLGVAELLGAHASTFTPVNTLEGLVAVWRLAGGLCFMRLLHRSRLTAGRLLALVVCIVGCLLVSQPEWFIMSNSGNGSNGTNYYGDNTPTKNYSSLSDRTWVGQDYIANTYSIGNHTLEVPSERYAIHSNVTFPLIDQLQPMTKPFTQEKSRGKLMNAHPHQGPSNKTTGSSNARTIQEVEDIFEDETRESDADYLIGCVICSVAGLFAGAWFTVAYVTRDLPILTLFFWTSLICAISSATMALHNETLVFPSGHPEQLTLLFTESSGAALVLYGATAGARLTNPIVAAVLLTLPLVTNMITKSLVPDSEEDSAVPVFGDSGWLGVSGGAVLICGVVYSLVLETWRRHCSYRRKALSDHYRQLNMGLGESMNSRVSRMTQT